MFLTFGLPSPNIMALCAFERMLMKHYQDPIQWEGIDKTTTSMYSFANQAMLRSKIHFTSCRAFVESHIVPQFNSSLADP